MRKIVDDVKDMSMCELMDNCMFIKNGEAWYRNFNEEMPFRDLMRKLIKHHVLSEDIYEEQIMVHWLIGKVLNLF